MKAYYLLALVGAALLSGCAVRSVAYEPLYTPATVAYVSPTTVAYVSPATVAYVSPTYIPPPPGTLLPGAGVGSLEAP